MTDGTAVDPNPTDPPIFKLPRIPTPPATLKAPVEISVDGVVFVMEVIPATFNRFAIPTPPVIFKAPVVGLVDSVSFVKVTTPSTFNFLSISAPPLTISAAFVPVKSVVSVISNLSILTKLVPSALITKFPVVAVILLPSTSMLSTVNLAIVAATPTFKVFVSV